MKLIRWVEERLSGRPRSSKRNANSSSSSSSSASSAFSSTSSGSSKEKDKRARQAALLASVTPRRDATESAQRFLRAPRGDEPHQPSPLIGASSSSRHHCADNEYLTILYPSSPSLTDHDGASGSAAATPARARSRIKTNPWLRSPWMPPRNSYGSTTSSDSTDSGCGLHETPRGTKCLSAVAVTSRNSLTNFRDSDDGAKSLERHRTYYSNTSSPEVALPKRISTTRNRTVTGLLDAEEEDGDGNCSSSDDVLSTASSSAFSSQSSNISSESEIVWSMRTLPSSSSLLSSGAIASASSIWSSNASLFSTNPSLPESHLPVATEVLPTLTHASPPNKPTRRCAAANKRRFMPMLSQYSRKTRNEEYVYTATDLYSDDDDSGVRHIRLAGQPFPEPCVPSPSSTGVAQPPRDFATPGLRRRQENKLRQSLATSDALSARLCHEVNDVPSPAPLDWSLERSCHHYSSLERSGHELIDDLFREATLRESIGSEGCSSLSPVSPATADSGLGLSDAMVSSVSSTPSMECPSAAASEAAVTSRIAAVTATRPRLASLASLSSPFCAEDGDYLSEKVSQLRVELKDVVGAAIHEAREEEIRMREERLAFYRELMDYKRQLLVQSLGELKHRLSDAN